MVTYDYETQPEYRLTLTVTDQLGGMASIAATVVLEDLPDAVPGTPGAPVRVTVPTPDGTLALVWSPPPSGAPVTGYALRYREPGERTFTPGPQALNTPAATLRGLAPGARYEVQAQAANAAGPAPGRRPAG